MKTQDQINLQAAYELLSERDDIGRAFRQTKKTIEKGYTDPKQVYGHYKHFQDKAKSLEAKFKAQGSEIPISHVIFVGRARNIDKRLSITQILEDLIFRKSNREISVSVFGNWAEHERFFEDYYTGGYILLRGTTRHMHEWYPVDAFTNYDEKEKTSSVQIRRQLETPGSISLQYTFDEGIVNVKDVKWNGYVFATPLYDQDLRDAKRFLEKTNLKDLTYDEEDFSMAVEL